MGNRGQFRAALRWCAVAAGREGLEIRTAMSAALDRGAIGIRLSPAARDLSPPAKTCHDLPRCVSFSGDAWRSARLRKNEVRKGFVPISRMDQKLWHIDESKRAEIRSVSSDLLPEIGAEGIQRPVTACHIESGDWRSVPWPAPSGLDGSFRDLFPGRCPGLSSTAPLVLKTVVLKTVVLKTVVLKSETCGRCFGGVADPRRTEGEVGDLLRTESNRGPFHSIKATDWQRKPTGRRHWTTTDDRIQGLRLGPAARIGWTGNGRRPYAFCRRTHL